MQNVGVRDWSSPTLPLRQSINNAAYPCTGSGTPVVSLAWDDPTTASGLPSTIRVTYLVRDVGGEHQLRRLLCRDSATVDAPGESDLVVVHNLVGTPPPPVCALAIGIPTPCNGTGVNFPQRVTLTVNIKHPSNPGATTSLVLTGQRRQS